MSFHSSQHNCSHHKILHSYAILNFFYTSEAEVITLKKKLLLNYFLLIAKAECPFSKIWVVQPNYSYHKG